MSDKKNKQKKFKKRGQESSSSTSSSSESTSSLSSDDESNARDLKPIKEYMGDRRELARQLFIAVKGDKLRMMLPQVLKKMELNELEDWCANELSGMSKARILSILNGQPMLQSSDSNDSDDSGPSLEIISDTEEWGDVSEVETTTREEESVSKKTLAAKKDKTRSKLRGERASKENEKTRGKSLKGRVKSETDPKSQKTSDLVKVKKETEGSEQSKEKDGESLLDLLELEMRARAIRALIRKEEDIIPANPSSSTSAQSSASNPSPNPSSISSINSKTRAKDRQLSLKVVQDKLQELDSSFNRSVNKNGPEISEEEDVVLVLQPTTTIELLSSESDDEGGQGKRRNQKLENERVPEKSTTPIVKEPVIGGEREMRKLEDARDRVAESEPVSNEKNKVSSTDSGCSSNSTKILSSETDKASEKSPKKVTKDLEMFRMFKKKSQLKELDNNEKSVEKMSPNSAEKGAIEAQDSTKSSSTSSEDKKVDTPSLSSSPKNAALEEEKTGPEEIVESIKPAEMDAAKIEPQNIAEKKPVEADEDKSTDLEIIIDLDDYPDDMEDLDTGDKSTNESNSNSNSEGKRTEVCKEDPAKSTDETEGQTAETWATRYYQTDDVQSVIKESKIQSEIRKRLRERQRLARLNNSPSLNAAQAVVAAHTSGAGKKSGEEKEGSVEEYLALKNSEAISTSSPDLRTADKKNEELEAGKIGESVLPETGSDECKPASNNEKLLASEIKEVIDKIE